MQYSLTSLSHSSLSLTHLSLSSSLLIEDKIERESDQIRSHFEFSQRRWTNEMNEYFIHACMYAMAWRMCMYCTVQFIQCGDGWI